MICISSLLLVGCGASIWRDVAMVERFFSWWQVGSSRDWLLVKNNFIGERDPVAIIFGFGDDHSFCVEIAEMYMGRYPATKYYCEPAN